MSAVVRPEIPPGGKAERPQQIPRQGWQQILKRSWAQTQADQVPLLGAGVAFFGFLALFPTLIAMVLAYGLFADPATIAAQVQSLGAALPPEVQKLITDQVTAQSQKTGALSVGLIISLVIALWSASGGVANLVQAVNTAYDETDDRNVIKKRLLALGLTVGAIVFMIVLVSLIALLPIVLAFVEASSFRWIVQIVRWLLIAVLIMVALAVLYRVAPDRTAAKLAWTSPGAIVATVVWLLVSGGFSLYITITANSSYTKTYGALAGIVVLLMWLWLTSYAVLFGAEVNAETERQTLVDTTVGPDRPVGRRGAVAADDKDLTGTADAETDPPSEDPAGKSAGDPGGTPSEVDALEADLVATRGRLTTNVGALAAKANLKTQAKKKATETTRQVVAKAEAKARRSPGAVAALAAGAGLVVGLLVRRGRSG
jgi:membrane protein